MTSKMESESKNQLVFDLYDLDSINRSKFFQNTFDYLNLNETTTTSTNGSSNGTSLLSIHLSTIDRWTELIDSCAAPVLASAGIFLNLVCILIFVAPEVKSTIYKYLLFNSLFDSFTLLMVLVRLAFGFSPSSSPSLSIHSQANQHLIYNSFVEIYFLIYLSSVSLTCSNLMKVGFSLDRFFKLKKVFKFYTKPVTFKYILLLVVLIGLAVNSPVLLGYELVADTRSRQTYYFATLNKYGRINSSAGDFIIANAIFVDLFIFVAVLVINYILFFSIKKNIKRLRNMIGDNAELIMSGDNLDGGSNGAKSRKSSKYSRINGKRSINVMASSIVESSSNNNNNNNNEIESDVEDVDDDLFSCEVIVTDLNEIENETTEQQQAKPEISCDRATTSKRSESESSDAAAQQSGDSSAESKVRFKFLRQKEKWFCVEAHKHTLSKMIVIMSILFVFGHFLGTMCEIALQIMFFNFYGIYLNLFFSRFHLIRLFMAIGNSMLYISLGSNFFIYFYYSQLFNFLFFKMLRKLFNCVADRLEKVQRFFCHN